MTVLTSSDFAGADIITFLAPAVMCFCAPSFLVKAPVHSKTISTPSSAQGRFSGFLSLVTLTFLPAIIRAFSLTSTFLLKMP